MPRLELRTFGYSIEARVDIFEFSCFSKEKLLRIWVKDEFIA